MRATRAQKILRRQVRSRAQIAQAGEPLERLQLAEQRLRAFLAARMKSRRLSGTRLFL
jgi:hypothetical protein